MTSAYIHAGNCLTTRVAILVLLDEGLWVVDTKPDPAGESVWTQTI